MNMASIAQMTLITQAMKNLCQVTLGSWLEELQGGTAS